MKYQGEAALVTGASSGIGEAFARELAARGTHVLLSSLPEEHSHVRVIADELTKRHQVRTEVIPMDLALQGAARRLQAAADKLDFEPDFLVNSAGIATGDAFAEAPLQRELSVVSVNVAALVELTGLYLPRMVARHHGGIINVASTAALQPIPYSAVYAASKAFVLSFGEALWAENHAKGVRVTTLCSGPVSTPLHEKAGVTGPATGTYGQMKRRYLTPEAVVKSALEALERDQPRVVRRLPGFGSLYVPLAVAVHLVPRRVALQGIERLFHWLYRRQ